MDDLNTIDKFERIVLAWTENNQVVQDWLTEQQKNKWYVEGDEIEDTLMKTSNKDIQKLYNKIQKGTP